MKNNTWLPLILAVLIALIVWGINAMLPDVTEESITQTSIDDTVAELTKDYNIDKLLESFPFTVSEEDTKLLEEKLELVYLALADKDNKEALKLAGEMEDILKPYWLTEDVIKDFAPTDIPVAYLLKEDADKLNTLLKDLKDSDASIGIEAYFEKLTDYTIYYYKAQNNILNAYKEGLINQKFMKLDVISDEKVLKLTGLLDQPNYDYAAFLTAMPFYTDKDDTNDLYYIYEDVLKNDSVAKKKLFDSLTKYWYKPDTLDNIFPYKIYKGAYATFSDEGIDALDKLKNTIDTAIKDEKIDDLIEGLKSYHIRYAEELNKTTLLAFNNLRLKEILEIKED